MAYAISITALLISIAGFAFNLYQYRKSRRVNLLSKSNEVLKLAYLISKAAHELRHKIENTDDVEYPEELFEKIELQIEQQFLVVLNSKNTTLEKVYEAEQALLGVDLELSLYSKTIDSAAEFNKEWNAFKNKS